MGVYSRQNVQKPHQKKATSLHFSQAQAALTQGCQCHFFLGQHQPLLSFLTTTGDYHICINTVLQKTFIYFSHAVSIRYNYCTTEKKTHLCPIGGDAFHEKTRAIRGPTILFFYRPRVPAKMSGCSDAPGLFCPRVHTLCFTKITSTPAATITVTSSSPLRCFQCAVPDL